MNQILFVFLTIYFMANAAICILIVAEAYMSQEEKKTRLVSLLWILLFGLPMIISSFIEGKIEEREERNGKNGMG